MALVVADRVRELTTTTGTGAVTLTGPVGGFQSFAAIGNGNTTFYTITDSVNDWEVGIGTYTSAGTSLSRDIVLASSNSGSLVPFGVGTKDVFVTYPAVKSVFQDEAQQIRSEDNGAIYLNSRTITTNNTITSGYNGCSVGPVTVNAGASVTVGPSTKWRVD